MNGLDESDPLRHLEERRREALRAVEEGGGGEAEGFELAEQELIDHATHADGHTPARIMRDAATEDPPRDDALYGEADAEHKAD